MRTLALIALPLVLLTQTGCGLLLGKVKPVDEKSDYYGVMDLSKEKPAEWSKLDPAQIANGAERDKDTTSSEVSDAVYQNKKTASTISINSACRPPGYVEKQDLRSVTNLLFLGLSDVTLRTERELPIQLNPALETTIRGKLAIAPGSRSKEEVMLRTVVLKKEGCVYDLVYLAPPQFFEANLNDFTQFVASLRLK